MRPVCYLCGEPLEAEEASADHVVPRGLLTRAQPKTKGFDYAGTLPTHSRCNNEFGPEVYAAKALDLLAALHDPECFHEYKHPTLPNTRMMALNAGKLPSFSRRDLKFFRMIDARPLSMTEMHDPARLAEHAPLDPRKQALFVALAVLTKSAAARIISRKLNRVPSQWDVLAMPFVGEIGGHEFDDLFGKTEPFDDGLKMWLGQLETNDYLAIYRARKVLVFFLFRFSASPAAWERMLTRFPEATRLRFHSTRLLEIMGYEWERV